MSHRRIFYLFIIIGTVIAASYGWTWVQQPSEISPPEKISIPLERAVQGSTKTAVQRINLWQTRVQQSPQDYISMTYLGQAYLERARESGQGDFYSRAETALNQALVVNPHYQPATAFLASVYFAQHQFSEALALAEAVYANDPAALHALALIGDAQLELGRYEEAESSYEKLQAQNQSPPVLSRLARLAWLQGKPEAAIAQMRRAAEEAVEMDMLGESAAWYQFQLGELYFQTGQLEAAQAQYALAITTFPDYYLARAGLAKAAAAAGNLDQAIPLYEQVVAAVPQPEFVAALGDLYTLTGNLEAAQQQYETVALIAQLAGEESTDNRQLVTFYANHDLNPAEAVRLAEQDLTVRADIYGYDALAWALYKNGRFSEAADAVEKALSLGTQDATMFYHAGMIYNALGRTTDARHLLQQALSINPYFDLRQTAVAQSTLLQLKNEVTNES